MRFTDTTTVTCKAGRGGNGVIAFDINKKPTGGDGGLGGDIYFIGDENCYDLSHLVNGLTVKGNNAENAIIKNKNETGRSAEDVVVSVPLTTRVLDENGEQIFYITEHGQKELICKGGARGRGNHYFSNKIHREGRYKSTKGKPGEIKKVSLILELYSDVIFIGYPNAGKSSLLNELTNAHVKVASYEFTTLKPQLGRLDGKVLMDLPGLIQGTYEGKGLGNSFVKHTKTARLLLHTISMENEDCWETYVSMWDELNNIDKVLEKDKYIDKRLCDKKELIVLTKHDLVDLQKVEMEKKRFKDKDKDFLIV